MDYNLKFKYEGERGYWNTVIYADNDESAICQSREFIKNNNKKIEKFILEKKYYKTKVIYKEDIN